MDFLWGGPKAKPGVDTVRTPLWLAQAMRTHL